MNRRDLFKGVFGAAIARVIPPTVSARMGFARSGGAQLLTASMITKEAARLLNESLMVKRGKQS